MQWGGKKEGGRENVTNPQKQNQNPQPINQPKAMKLEMDGKQQCKESYGPCVRQKYPQSFLLTLGARIAATNATTFVTIHFQDSKIVFPQAWISIC